MPGIEPDLILTKDALYPELQRLKGLPGFDSTSSGRRDSNSATLSLKADALPTELLPLILFIKTKQKLFLLHFLSENKTCFQKCGDDRIRTYSA